jgi:hypothetical protein
VTAVVVLAVLFMFGWRVADRPALNLPGEPVDPAPVLEQTLRELRTLLVARQASRAALRRMRIAGRLAPATAGRRLMLQHMRDRDTQIARLRGRLVALVDACAGCLGQRLACRQTWRPAQARADAVALAERATGVIGAFRELTS